MPRWKHKDDWIDLRWDTTCGIFTDSRILLGDLEELSQSPIIFDRATPYGTEG